MTPEEYYNFVEQVRSRTLGARAYAGPDSIRLANKLHEGTITLKQFGRLVIRMTRAGYLEGKLVKAGKKAG